MAVGDGSAFASPASDKLLCRHVERTWCTMTIVFPRFGSRNELTRMVLGIACLASCQATGAFSQTRSDADVSLQYLNRHGVPCRSIVSAAVTVMNDIVTCEDGRQWVLFWLENEVAYVPPSRELYKWRREIDASYPEVYGGSRALVQASSPGSPHER